MAVKEATRIARDAAGSVAQAIWPKSLIDIFDAMDAARRAQARALTSLGIGPIETEFRILASGAGWRLRAYSGRTDGPAVLVVAAPVKRPYIWDLAPSLSAIRVCHALGMRIFLIEWMPPRRSEGFGFGECASAIGACVAHIAGGNDGVRPFLIGHSLGGTLAAIYAALSPDTIQGLVLLGSPLCFRRGASPFGDVLVSIVPDGFTDLPLVPGSLLSELSALASPDEFVWGRLVDAALSLPDRRGAALHLQIERWALDEVALSGRLVGQILQLLYREDQFCQGILSVHDRLVGPSCLRLPTLAAVNHSDHVAPRATVTHFLNQLPLRDTHVIEYPGEVGVCLQHLALLVGRKAHEKIWPEIASWIRDHD
jgi:polyhydroxyalkanoate synthase subunit PhaC